MKKKKFSLFLLVTLLVSVTALMSFALVACNPDDDAEFQTGEEAGIYYYDAGDDEYTLSLGEGTQFALAVAGASSAGKYTLNGEDLTLTSNKEGEAQLTAKYNGNVIVLKYSDTQEFRFLKKINYTVSFESNGGNSVNSVNVINGKKVAKPSDPQKNGYIFVGWYADAEFKAPFSFNSQMITANTTVFARWTEKQVGGIEYAVDFKADNGAASPVSVTTKGGKVFDLPQVTRDGYTFKGWWVSMNGDGKLSYQVNDGMSLDSDTTLIALWQSNSAALAEPVVNVEASSVRWEVVDGARDYILQIKDSSGAFIVNEIIGGNTKNVNFAGLAEGDYTITVTARSASAEATATRVYKNKALARVSGLKIIEPATLLFNPVNNAERYLIQVNCGDKNHMHNERGVKLDNGTSTSFNFADCEMQNGGIRFTVTAMAGGWASSVSNEYVYAPTLGAISEFSLNDSTQKLVWNNVANATGYMVSINGGEYKNIGAVNSVSLKECAQGSVTVKVYPVSKMYISPAAGEFNYNKPNIASPKNITVNGTVVSWDAVTGATSYDVRIAGRTQTTNTTSVDIASIQLTENTDYAITVVAKGATNSLETDPVIVSYLGMSNSLKYENSVLSWKPVVGASLYQVQINDANPFEVSNGANSVKIELTKPGENVLKVRFMSSTGSFYQWVSTTVYAHTVTFVSDGGSGVSEQYKAVGDAITLPTPQKEGYDFLNWYTTVRGPESNGAAYRDDRFNESKDIVLYACYTSKKYAANYIYGDGGNGSAVFGNVWYKKSYNLTVPTPNDATSVFAGWYSAPNGGGAKLTDDKGNSLGVWNQASNADVYAFYFTDVLSFTYTTTSTGKPIYAVMQGSRISQVSELTIPAEYKGYPVGMISGNAFKGCSNLTLLNIPDTVEIISEVDTFTGCLNLTDINVYSTGNANSIRYWSSDGVLFEYIDPDQSSANKPSKLRYMPLGKTGSYAVPSGVVTLPSNSFANSALSRVIIPTSVTSIGMEAFVDCSNLSAVVFGEGSNGSLTIGDSAFKNCVALETITLPAHLTSIGLDKYELLDAVDSPASKTVSTSTGITNAFEGCKNLESIHISNLNKNYRAENGMIFTANGSTLLYALVTVKEDVTIPGYVSTIANGAFIGCDFLSSVTIPGSVTSVGECAFYNTGLKTATFEGTGFAEVSIGKYAFRGCSSLRSVVFEDGNNVTSLGEGAFFDCNDSQFRSIVLPKNLKNIGAQAFRGCTSLASIDIASESDNLIFGNDAFYNCSRLATITLPKNLSKLPGVFGGCASLENVIVSEGNTHFKSIEGVLFDYSGETLLFYPRSKATSYIIPDTVKTIEAGVFGSNQNLTSITIGKNVTKIGDNAFRDCINLTSITFEQEDGAASTLEIGEYAFYKAGISKSATMNLTLPSRTTKVGAYAFAEMTYLDTFAFSGDKLETISEGAFYNDRYLKNVTIPASVKTIGAYAFYYNVGESMFNRTTAISIEEDSKLTSIGDYAFASSNAQYKSIVSIELRQGLESIGYRAFYNAGISEITIPNSVSVIGAEAFSASSFENSTLTSVTFEADGIKDLILGAKKTEGNSYEEGNVFAKTRITSVELPARMTFLGESAFENCSLLTTATFAPNSRLQHIGANSFNGTKISSITVPYTVANGNVAVDGEGKLEYRKAIGDYAFANTALLENVIFAEPETAPAANDAVAAGTLSFGNSVFYNANKIATLNLPARLGDFYENGNTSGTRVSGFSVKTFSSSSQSADSLLSTVVIPDGCKDYCVVDGVVYTKDKTTIVLCPVAKTETVNIEETVTSIQSYAFAASKISGVTFSASKDDADLTIGEGAFYDCNNITNVVLSDNVTQVGNRAFGSCDSLTNFTLSAKMGSTYNENIFSDTNIKQIDVSADHPDLKTINGTLFSKDGKTLKKYSKNSDVEKYVVPDGVETIEANAFSGNTTVKEVVLPSGLKTIGQSAFYGCTSLTKINIPGTVTTIQGNVFQSCTALTALTFDADDAESLSIGNYAFQRSGLTEITLPARLTSMESYVFYGCSALQTVTFNTTKLTQIKDWTFYNCTALSTVSFPSSVKTLGNRVFNGCTSLVNFEFTEGIETLGEYTFAGCTGLKTVKIAASLKTMGVGTFSDESYGTYCESLETVEFVGKSQLSVLPKGTFYKSGLKSITIPASVTKLDSRVYGDYGWEYSGGYGVFQGCERLNSVIFEENSQCAEIGNAAFMGCTALESFTIPASVSKLGISAFEGAGLTSIVIPSTATVYGKSLFNGCASLTDVTLNQNATSLPDYMFSGCTLLTEITIPASVTTFGSGMFTNTGFTSFIIPTSMTEIPYSFLSSCKSLTSVTLHSAITKIGSSAFSGSALQSIQILEGVTSIDESAFANCASLATVNLPDSLETIGEEAFSGCTSLESIVIPSKVTSLEDDTFADCTELNSVKLPAGLTNLSESAFSGCGNISFSVDNAKPDGFRIDAGTGILYNGNQIVSVPSTVTGEFTIPSDVTGIVEGAFASSKVTKLILPASMTVITPGAFMGCTTLQEVVILGNVTEIGYYAFYGCTSLTTIKLSDDAEANGFVLPDTVEAIGEAAFYRCTMMSKITLPSNLTQLGGVGWSSDYAVFGYCTDLKEIVIPDGVTDLVGYTFAYSGIETITLPSSLASFNRYTFSNCGVKNIMGGNDKYKVIYGALYQCEPDGNGGTRSKLLYVPSSVSGEFMFSPDMYSIDSNSGLANCQGITTYSMDGDGNSYYQVIDGVLYALKDSYGRATKMLYSVPNGKTGTFVVSKDVMSIDSNAFKGSQIDLLMFEGGRSSRFSIGYSTDWLKYASVKAIVISLESFSLSNIDPFTSYYSTWSKENTVYFVESEEQIEEASSYFYSKLDDLKEIVNVVFNYDPNQAQA